ncbi:MAG TPA: HEAT repeat domain-containing protein [Planctomycetota bacterium]|nr:HEAT repeat domain-containing protein [Planctomycetota bacterium]HRR80593.1 HEAT repeat domain-containing protein [Planctomycetota bacterium]HRT95824.1 HEAT repeat domain-containing protein [Planctomycetota bacterium]
MKRILFAMFCLGAACLLGAEPRSVSFEGAQWIWAWPDPGANTPEPSAGVWYFRAALVLPENAQVKAAEATIAVDNLYALSVNGQFVGQRETNPDAWRIPNRFDLAPLLVPGRNVIAVEAANTAPGPAGLLFVLRGQLADGQPIALAGGENWLVSDREAKDWQQPGFDDSKWQKAYVVAPYGGGPWGRFADKLEAVPVAKPKLGKAPALNWQAAAGPVVSVRPSVEVVPPEDYPWPEGLAFVGDDCSLYIPRSGTGSRYDSLTVTIFNPRKARTFPEHDLPAPMKVGRKLYALTPARPGAKPAVLLDAGKGAIGSPSVTFDGKAILVSMVPEGEGFFSIWRLPAAGGTPERLTRGPFHDIDPAELPDGRIVFTSTRIGTFEEYHNPPSRALFVMNPDGSGIRPITTTFIFDNEPEVLADGRILFIRSDNFFDRGKVETLLHAVHPDGTGGYTEFGLDIGPDYGGRLRAFCCGSPAPMPDGRVAWLTGGGIAVGPTGGLPFGTRHFGLDAGDVAALPDGRLVCTLARRVEIEVPAGKQTRKVQDISYEKIAILDPDSRTGGVVILHDSQGMALHSPVYLGPRPRPPVLAGKSKPHKGDAAAAATGVLFCQDARLTKNTTAGWSHVRALRVLGGKGLTLRSSHSYIVHAGSEVVELGTVPLAPDGSFAIEVPGDMAIAFQAVDAEGRSELNEMSWIYVRPGETRGCIGCHAERRLAAPNSAPTMQALQARPLKLLGQGQPHRFRGNNAAVTGLMEMQFDRYREVAGLNRHAGDISDPPLPGSQPGPPSALRHPQSPDPTGPQEVAALIAQLANLPQVPNLREVQISAAQRLAVFRDPAAAPALAECLKAESREARVAAALALAACGTRDSVPPLLAALTDEDPLVAQAANIALENLTGHAEPQPPAGSKPAGGSATGIPSAGGDAGPHAPSGFDGPASRARLAQAWRAWLQANPWDKIEADLVQRLASEDRDVVRRAAVALGHTGGDAARAALRAYVTKERQNNPYPEWRKAHNGDNARFNALSPANPRTPQAATRALGYLKDRESVGLLADTLNRLADPGTGNLFLAEACAEALGRIGTPEAEAALIEAFPKLKDYPHHAGWYGDHGALIACHAAPIHYFIIEALDALGSTKAAAIVPHLIRSVPTDPDRALFAYNDDYEAVTGRVIRRNGAEEAVVETCLATLGDPEAKPVKEIQAAFGTHGAWAGRPDPENRAAQVLSLACRDRKWEPRIRAALERYRAKPVDIIREFDHGIPVVHKLPVRHWVCFFLARALGNLADPQSAEALIAALEQSPAEGAAGHPDPLGPGVLFLHQDLTPCWRAAVAWALGRIGDKRAVPVLLQAAGEMKNAPDTRHAAAEALERLADPASLDALRALAASHPEVSTRQALLRAAAAAAR